VPTTLPKRVEHRETDVRNPWDVSIDNVTIVMMVLVALLGMTSPDSSLLTNVEYLAKMGLP
jgi:hypothetical protein